MTPLEMKAIVTNCVRCGRSCQGEKSHNPTARPFRKAQIGLCADCAVTSFLQCGELEALRNNLLSAGLEALKNPNIQGVFKSILLSGKSELPMDEINWDAIIENWYMPFPKGYKP